MFSKCFPSIWKRKPDVFKFLWFEERFRKVPFSWRISVDGRPNRRNKDAFLIFSGVLWMPSQSAEKHVDMNFSKQSSHKGTPWVGRFFLCHCNSCRCTRGRVAALVRYHVNESEEWSFFTLIYNRSSNIWTISYILHIISLLMGDMNSINWPRSLRAQLVEHRTGIAEVTGSNPVEALIFFRLLLSNCFNWKIYCDDHFFTLIYNRSSNI